MNSFYRELVVPESVAWSIDQVPSLRAAYDLDWPPGFEPNRILTKNYGHRVVVCMPTLDLPSITRSAPVFTDLQATVTIANPEHVTDVIDAATTYLEPDGPEFFYSGVKFDEVQTLSTTPNQFMEDLERIHHPDAIEALVDDPRHPNEATEPRLPIAAAAAWPVRDGWFYLTGSHLTEHEEPRWRVGLLLPDPLVDLSDVLSFFDALTDDRPRYQVQWPHRALVVDATYNRPALTYTEEVEGRIGGTESALAIHGTNPLYGTDIETITNDPEAVPSDLSVPLHTTSSFLYEVDGGVHPGGTPWFEQVTAVEPPSIYAVFVAARARYRLDEEDGVGGA